MLRTRVVLLTLVMGLSLVLTACGGGSSTGSAPAAPTSKSEWRLPDGSSRDGRPPLALMIIYGSGWTGDKDPGGFEAAKSISALYRQAGFATMSVQYRAGTSGLTDVEAAYAEVRRHVGPRTPVCAAGWSSGGNLALMLAVREPDLACVVAKAAPTDIPALKDSNAATYALAQQELGDKGVRELSPVRFADRIRSRLLLEYAENDTFVPVEQGRRMLRAHPRDTTLDVLPAGQAGFIHSKVDAAAKKRADAQELQLYQQAKSAG